MASNPINPASPTNLNPSNLPAVIPPFPGLEPGRYVFLVLARRDLPRRFCTITAAKISYSGCNTIEHSYSVTGENQIRIIGGATSTGNKCTVNND